MKTEQKENLLDRETETEMEMEHPDDGAGSALTEDATGTPELYPGDTGELPEEARRVLVQLLAGPFLDSRRHRHLWAALLRFESRVRSRLADLFLELVLDSAQQVAFVRQADTGELETPILLRRTRLTFLESVLLLYLRQLLAEAETQGERAVVALPEMVEQLKLYEQSVNTDHAGFERRIHAAIEKVKKNNVISAIRHTEDRFEISPTLKLLFSAEEIAALRRSYLEARAGGACEPEGETE